MDGLQQVVELARSRRFPTNPDPGAPINVAWVHTPDGNRIEVWRGKIGKDDYKVVVDGVSENRLTLAQVLDFVGRQ